MRIVYALLATVLVLASTAGYLNANDHREQVRNFMNAPEDLPIPPNSELLHMSISPQGYPMASWLASGRAHEVVEFFVQELASTHEVIVVHEASLSALINTRSKADSANDIMLSLETNGENLSTWIVAEWLPYNDQVKSAFFDVTKQTQQDRKIVRSRAIDDHEPFSIPKDAINLISLQEDYQSDKTPNVNIVSFEHRSSSLEEVKQQVLKDLKNREGQIVTTLQEKDVWEVYFLMDSLAGAVTGLERAEGVYQLEYRWSYKPDD